jgi:hypothetical protein
MSANQQPNLSEVKIIFEKFRVSRKGKEHLPESLWATAVALLAHYPFSVVRRELKLKADYLRKRAAMGGQPSAPAVKRKKSFLAITGQQLTAMNNVAAHNTSDIVARAANQCCLVLERSDGNRLTITMPIDWPGIQSVCSNFWHK